MISSIHVAQLFPSTNMSFNTLDMQESGQVHVNDAGGDPIGTAVGKSTGVPVTEETGDGTPRTV